MARPLRIERVGGRYHATARGNERGQIFLDDPDRFHFLELLFDFLLPHWNGTSVEQIPARVKELKRYGKPVVCNEDDKIGATAVAAMRATVASGAGYGLMLNKHNQTFPFHFDGAADDPVFYAEVRRLTTSTSESLNR